MSPRIPRLTADQAIRITIPYHKGKMLHPKLVKAIARDLGISLEELLRIS